MWIFYVNKLKCGLDSRTSRQSISLNFCTKSILGCIHSSSVNLDNVHHSLRYDVNVFYSVVQVGPWCIGVPKSIFSHTSEKAMQLYNSFKMEEIGFMLLEEVRCDKEIAKLHWKKKATWWASYTNKQNLYKVPTLSYGFLPDESKVRCNLHVTTKIDLNVTISFHRLYHKGIYKSRVSARVHLP